MIEVYEGHPHALLCLINYYGVDTICYTDLGLNLPIFLPLENF